MNASAIFDHKNGGDQKYLAHARLTQPWIGMTSTLQTTAESKQIPAHLRLRIVPASECPARVESRGHYQFDDSISPRETFRFYFAESSVILHERHPVGDGEACTVDKNDKGELDLTDWQKLAAGEKIPVKLPTSPEHPGGLGTASLHWIVGVGSSPLTSRFQCVLGFEPASPVAPGISFADWLATRFPGFAIYGFDSQAEALRLFFYHRWVEETRPGSSHASHREILHEAAIDNLEHLVAAVLEQVGGVDEGPIERITETALGIAMDNHGEFGASATFTGGCHRNYRDDDFCMAEDSATWLPRAQRIIEMLKAGGAVDYFPIIKACAEGNLAEVRRLLAAGFPPNFAVYGYSTTLCEAAVSGHLEVCRLLLAAGADPNLPRPFDSHFGSGGMIYPLQAAREHLLITKLLIEAGADPGIRSDDCDQTPIALRGAFTCEEGAKLIFQKVAFSSLRDRTGKSGLHLLKCEELEFCREFIPGDLIDLPDHTGMTPLLYAVGTQDLCKIRWLLIAGASVNQVSIYSGDSEVNWNFVFKLDRRLLPLALTPLQMALLNGDYPVLLELLSRGAIPTDTMMALPSMDRLAPEDLREVRAKLTFHETDLFTPETMPLVQESLETNNTFLTQGMSWSELMRIARIIDQDPDLITEFHEVMEPKSVKAVATSMNVPDLCLKTYHQGRPLTAIGFLGLAQDALSAASLSTDEFESALRTGDKKDPDACHLMEAIDKVEDLIDLAVLEISGEAPPKRNLSAAIESVASGEFDGGAARARLAVQTTGEVEFDDFLDALRENLKPGSTMDFGKLIQAARRTLTELDAECVSLMRKL